MSPRFTRPYAIIELKKNAWMKKNPEIVSQYNDFVYIFKRRHNQLKLLTILLELGIIMMI